MDLNYRQRSENIDEFVFLVHPTLEKGSPSLSSKKKRCTIPFVPLSKKIHKSIWNGRATFIHETLTGHEAVCKRQFHVETKKEAIYNYIQNEAAFIHETLTGHEAVFKRQFHIERDFSMLSFKDCVDLRYLFVEE